MHKKWIMPYSLAALCATVYTISNCNDQLFYPRETTGATSPIVSPFPSPEKKASEQPMHRQLRTKAVTQDPFGAYFLVHGRYLNPTTNKLLPGAVSPITSPFESPEKKTPEQPVRSQLRKPACARALFGAKENRSQETTDTELSESSKEFVDSYLAAHEASVSTNVKKKLRRNSWSSREDVADAAQQAALFAQKTHKAAQEFHMFDGVHKSWQEDSTSLETLIADNCDKSSRGRVVLQARHASPLDLLEHLQDSKNRFGLAHEIAKGQTTPKKS